MTISKAYACRRTISRKVNPFVDSGSKKRTIALRKIATASLICAALGLLISCGSGPGGISIQITSGLSQSIDQGQTLQLTATVGGDTRNLGVTWSIPTTNTTCSGANCGTLTNTTPFLATYTAPTNLATSLTVTIEAISIANTTVTKTIAITVVLPPTFTTTGLTECQLDIFCLTNGSNGVPYSQSIQATGGIAPLTFTTPAGSLPAGLSMSVLGVITGRPSGPTSAQPNPVVFTVTVKDSAATPLTVTQQYSISISPKPPLAITSPSTLPGGYINGSYSTAIATVGGVPPLTWTLLTPPASLPAGLNLGVNSGQITGVPAPSNQTATPYTFTVQVVDSSLPTPGQTQQATLSIQILSPPALAISTTSVPTASTATGYNASLVATGGIPPYKWSLTGGQLPAGLTFGSNGVITGTPIIATTTPAEFTVEVQDSEVSSTGAPQPKSATANLSLTVNAGTVNNENTVLTGSYTFLFQGFDSFGPVAIAGSFGSSGNGVITSGFEDINRVPESGSDSGVVTGASLTGTYSLGTDGRGTMELIATNPITKVLLTTDYQMVMEADRSIHLFENDLTGTRGNATLKPVVGPATFATGSFNGNYAFLLTGQDSAAMPTGFGGVVTSDGAANLSGGVGDFNEGGTFSPAISVSGDFGGVAANRGTASLTFQLPSKSQVTLAYAFYFVSASDIYFVAADPTDATHPKLSGEFVLQQPSIQFSNSSLAGPSVVTGTGLDGKSASVLAGLLTGTIASDGSTSATLSYDQNDGGSVSSAAFPCGQCSAPTYSVATNGRATVSNLAAPSDQPRLAAAYLTSPGTGFFVGSDAAVTTGLIEQQQQPLLPAVTFTAANLEGGYTVRSGAMAENQVANVVGQVVGTGAGSVTGTLDEIDPTSPNLDQTLVKNYTVAANGRGTMTATGPVGFPSNLALYIVSPGSVRLISTDSNPGNGHPYVIFFDH